MTVKRVHVNSGPAGNQVYYEIYDENKFIGQFMPIKIAHRDSVGSYYIVVPRAEQPKIYSTLADAFACGLMIDYEEILDDLFAAGFHY